jgi:hypothetical protein
MTNGDRKIMSSNPEIRGILIEQATSLLSEIIIAPWDDEQGFADSESGVFTDPVWIPADTIDKLIQNGAWEAGQLDNVRCAPAGSEWPDRWRELKRR